MEDRGLDWPLCQNARDLGGIPVEEGRQIRARAVVRCDNLNQLNQTGQRALRSAGVSRIVDLRSVWECQRFPSPFAEDPLWVNVPLTDPADPDESALDLTQQYRNLLDRHQTRFAEAIAAIADAPPGCVVVTCHAGKDRTGLVVARTLHHSGVTAQAIGADYAILSTRGPGQTPTAGPAAAALLPETALPHAQTIIIALDHLHARYGGTDAYLTGGGVTAAQLDGLTARLCETGREH
jgi:protein-tyrosine phosphatase